MTRAAFAFRAPVTDVIEGSVLDHYDIDTFKGQSGSPIWTSIDGHPIVAGIHTGGGDPNVGLRMTPEIVGAIAEWVAGNVA